MERLTTEFQNSYIRILSAVFNNDFSDIVAVKKTHYYLKSIVFSFCNYTNLTTHLKYNNFDSLEKAISSMDHIDLLSFKINNFYRKNKLLIDTEFADIIRILLMDSDKYSISLLYEYQLSYELRIMPTCIQFIPLKNSRDVTGSYYTPRELAYATTRRALDAYIESRLGIADFSLSYRSNEQIKQAQELLINAQVVDISCGCGEFLLAVEEYASLYLALDASEIVKNFWGIDIDPIALQIATINSLKGSQPENYEHIIKQFILGNPLIEVSIESPYEDKVDLFAINRVYAAEMGLNLSKRFAKFKFDIILGNPPWEKIRLEERKFFFPLCPDVSEISQKSTRSKRILLLQDSNPSLYNYYLDISSDYSEFKQRVKLSSFLEHSLSGELNTYALFAELAVNLLNINGLSSLILKSALITSPANSGLFRHFVGRQLLWELYLFTNINKIFNIDSREKFCVVLFLKNQQGYFRLAVGLQAVNDLETAEKVDVTSDMLQLINPFTGLLPNITSGEEFALLLATHDSFPVFEKVFGECHFGRLVHLTSHSEHIDKSSSANNIPIYEGKFIEQYDARFATFDGIPTEKKYTNKASAKKITKINPAGNKPLPESRFFIQKDLWPIISKNYTELFSLCWRSLTSSTNSRTTIATILPHCPTCQSIQLLQTSNPENLLLMVALFNSIPFDYFVRLKLPGIDLTQNIIKQIPVPPLSAYEENIFFKDVLKPIKYHIFDRVFQLFQNEVRVQALFAQCSYAFPHFQNPQKSKKIIMSELDLLIAKAYNIRIESLKSIAATFPNYYSSAEVDLLF